jgi:hypothetical protein
MNATTTSLGICVAQGSASRPFIVLHVACAFFLVAGCAVFFNYFRHQHDRDLGQHGAAFNWSTINFFDDPNLCSL